MQGRGASTNPPGRFEPLHLEPDPDLEPDSDGESGKSPRTTTEFFHDRSVSIIAHNDSPDIGFDASVNPYRGCEHGCVYCYARPTHEYLGFSAGLDFESRIMVKEQAPELLRRELSARRWKPRVIAFSGVTDCYQPVERRLEITRRCLQVTAEFRNPVVVVTKNDLISRDTDILQELAAHDASAVYISLTTLDDPLRRRLEPRTSSPNRRLELIRRLSAAGIPTGILVAPVIPALNDHEIPGILKAAAEAGAQFAGYVLLRLPFGLKDIFGQWLEEHYPDRRSKVLNQLAAMRNGALNDPQFGDRMKGCGDAAARLKQWFEVARRRAGIRPGGPGLSTAAFRRPDPDENEGQLRLFN